MIVVETTIKGVVEEREINTDVGLCCRFPLNVVVANLYSLESRLKNLSSIGACNVVGCTKAIATEVGVTIDCLVERVTGSVGYFLVTGLT